MSSTIGIVRVGGGRGFLVARRNHLGHDERIIITAAHCLPKLPSPHPARYLEEETYGRLLGPLGSKRTVWTACMFVDPMADIAVLGSPDNQDLSDEAEAYDQLVDSVTPFVVADAPAHGTELFTLPFGGHQVSHPTAGKGIARVLSLKGRWLDGEVHRFNGWLSYEPKKHFVGGMSGSPIVDATTGAAIGVVSVDRASPVIVVSLSAQLVRSILAARSADAEIRQEETV